MIESAAPVAGEVVAIFSGGADGLSSRRSRAKLAALSPLGPLLETTFAVVRTLPSRNVWVRLDAMQWLAVAIRLALTKKAVHASFPSWETMRPMLRPRETKGSVTGKLATATASSTPLIPPPTHEIWGADSGFALIYSLMSLAYVGIRPASTRNVRLARTASREGPSTNFLIRSA